MRVYFQRYKCPLWKKTTWDMWIKCIISWNISGDRGKMPWNWSKFLIICWKTWGDLGKIPWNWSKFLIICWKTWGDQGEIPWSGVQPADKENKQWEHRQGWQKVWQRKRWENFKKEKSGVRNKHTTNYVSKKRFCSITCFHKLNV